MALDDFSVPTAVQPDVRPPRRWRVSWVWSVPVLAALVGLSLLYKTVIDRGPAIVVTFQAATGIEAGKTKVKVKDVEIGQVTAVHLAPDRSHVEVMIELAKEARSFTARDSRFWVVRPRFAGSGISGLETLMSGAYIAAEGGRASDTAERFTGLETPPVIATDLPGRRFQLEAEDSGSLDVGAPVFFRRLPVGQVEGVALNPRGRGVSIGIFVHAPYDRFVTVGTRFWHASGIDFSLDARGLRVDTQSLAAILMGGIAFETPDDPGADDFISEGASFPLSRNRASALEPVHEGAFSVLMRFNQSVRGLEVGAPLDLRGVEVGRVKAIRLVYEPRTRDFVPVVEGEIYPDQLETLAGGARDLLTHGTESLGQQIEHGLRAQLRSDSLLTGKLFVAVDFFPDAPRVAYDPKADPPELPTVKGDMQEITQQVQAVLRKVSKIPFDTLGEDAHVLMTTLNATVARLDTTLARTDKAVLPEVRDALRELRQTVEALRGATSPDAPLQQDLRQTLQGLGDAARALRTLADTVESQPESLLRGRRESNR